MNRQFFKEACDLKMNGNLKMNILQGMEHQLDAPSGCNGYVVSLTNVEPLLVRSMYEKRSNETNRQILKKFMEYNLGADWYVSLKAFLFQQGLFRSSEQVQQFVHLDPKTLVQLKK